MVRNEAARRQLTSRIGKHAHQGGQLGRAATMSNVQPTSGGTMNTASSLRSSGLALLLGLLLALLLLGLLLLHVEQADGYKHQYARRVRSMKVSGVSGQMSWNSVKPSVGLGCR